MCYQLQSSASSQDEAGTSPEEWFVLILLFNLIYDDTGEISQEAGKQFLAGDEHQPAAFLYFHPIGRTCHTKEHFKKGHKAISYHFLEVTLHYFLLFSGVPPSYRLMFVLKSLS